MTEDEAKTKMCCGPQIVAMATLISAPTGAVEMTRDAGRCVASACMAWRWRALPGVCEKMVQDPTATASVQIHTWMEAGDGYCGLAGAPV